MTLTSQPSASEDHFHREFTLVAIGASAGGLEALQRFFANVLETANMAYVVIQHLSPEHRSVMDELLARHTRLPIHNATNGQLVEPNHIYLNPPGKVMVVSDGRLLMSDREMGSVLSLPIDHFFRSLAHDLGPRAVAIVLSGTGSDGSRGICDVQQAGGLVLVQDDETARFDGMPRSARETGKAWAILAPEEMPAKILKYFSSSECDDAFTPKTSLSTHTADGMTRIMHLLKRNFGLDFTQYRAGTITRRIERRILLHQSDDLLHYARELETDERELNQLYRDLLIGVTRFFRDQEAFDYLNQSVLPPLLRQVDPNRGLRIWIAGTGTGEEAYSIAMLVTEQMERMKIDVPIKIFATDVHQESLNRAARGIYNEESLGNVADDRREKFFLSCSEGYRVSPALRKLIVFAPHNIIRDAPFTSLDLVTCRNLLIYLEPHAQKKVLSLFHFALNVGGVLWLGPSESTGNLGHEFINRNEPWRFYEKSRDVRIAVAARKSASSGSGTDYAAERSLKAPKVESLAIYDRVLDAFMPPSLLVALDHTLSHTFAGGSRYLRFRDGRPSTEVFDLVLPELRAPVVMSLARAAHDRSPVVLDVATNPEESKDDLRLVVRPLFDHAGTLFHYVISFEAKPRSLEQVVPQHADVDADLAHQMQAMETELQYTKRSLQATIEELESSNEQLQAANEELIASNEELQSTNEELQSVNEELYTVNAEFQRKIAELTELTDDMDNLFNSTNVDIVFLDRELRIRKFTPGVAQTINLIPQDVGRRIDSFTNNIRNLAVLDCLENVLATEQTFEAEVEDNRANWYLLRILPYFSKKVVDGVVITMINITSLKEATMRLEELSEIVEHSADAILRIDLDGTIRTWNPGAAGLFGYADHEVLTANMAMLLPPSEQSTCHELLRQLVSGQTIHVHQTVWVHKSGRDLHVSLRMSPIKNTAYELVGASVIAHDITELKRAELEIREAVRRRDQFLAMLSHELRNPFAAILNATSLLKEDALDEATQADAREVVEHQLHHVARLLDDLLDVARFTNDKLLLHREAVDLTNIVMDVVDCVQHRIEESQQFLEVETPDSGLFVYGDIGRLQQAQVNLLVNASKYSPSGATIRYSLRRVAGNAVITVSDSGDGIPAEILNTIFDPFVQGEQALERSQGGMGLGLTLVKMIVEAHEGEVRAGNQQQGIGAEFTITLPLTPESPLRVESREAKIPAETRLLLIEDNDAIRRMLARSLELKGFVVRTARDGRDGLHAWKEFRPQVAVVDIGLPDIDGYELARTIRSQDDRYVLLVAVTGYGREEDRSQAVAAGFDLHLVKPIDPNELVGQVVMRLRPASLPVAT